VPIKKAFFSESKETRRRLLWQLFQQLLDKNQDVFGKDKRLFTFDCASLLYCNKDLGLKEGSKAKEFMLNHDPVSPIRKKMPKEITYSRQFQDTLEERCRSYIRRIDNIKVTILRTGTVNLRNAAAAYIQGDRSVVQFLEILSSQRLFEQNNHYCFGNRM
jgi:hypothetical protein